MRYSQTGIALGGDFEYEGRKDNDFYPTPDIFLRALFTKWKPPAGTVWEPACGNGNLTKYMQCKGYTVYSSDIAEYTGVSYERKDFMSYARAPEGVTSLITNPPYGSKFVSSAEDFLIKAHLLKISHIALLLRSNYWSAKNRVSLFETHKPKYIFQLTFRPDFQQKGNPTMDVCWNVWEPDTAYTTFDVLTKPEYTYEEFCDDSRRLKGL